MQKLSQKTIDYHLDQAEKIALKIVEQKARKILAQHPNLDEFIMGMGGWFFTTKRGDRIAIDYSINTHTNTCKYEGFKYLLPLEKFLMKYDEYLKLTGNPMRFTAKGKKITDW